MAIMVWLQLVLVFASWHCVDAQQMRSVTLGYSTSPYSLTPRYYFTPFQFSVSETIRYASSVPVPLATTTYAQPYRSISHVLPSRSSTTWGSFLPNATSAAIIPNDTQVWYGQSAWSSLWIAARLANYTTTGLYHTTVSPTPIPTSELIFPPENIPVKYAVDNYTFPSSFMFGVAGSASQCEGAVAMEGRTPSIQEAIYTNYSADSYVTNEHYFMYKQDILRLASMGVEYYSFSISWTRILPFVFSGTPVNKQGVDHYADVIDFTLAAGMKPIVTLLHFDNPLEFIRDSLLQKPEFGYHHGGFDNATWPDAFVAYGKLVMSLYAEKVPVWVTINEPMLYAANAIGISNVIHTHAELYKFYHNTINGTGKVGFKLNNNFGIPSDPSNETHVEAANWFNELWLGPIGYPICLSQDYPKAYKMTLKNVTSLTLTDLSAVGNTTDFFGIDPYTATAISPPPGGLAACAANASHPLHPYCVTQSFVDKSGWEIGYGSQGTAAYIAPKYFREYFSYVYNTYKKPVFITEFGFPVFGEATKTLSHQRFDLPRSLYYTGIMAEILKSIWEDGVQIIGALAWTFADDWEFTTFDTQYGLQAVNRTTQQRTYKKSFFDFVEFYKTRKATG